MSLTGTTSLSDQDRPWWVQVNETVVPGLAMAKDFLLAPVPISSERTSVPSRPSEGVVPEDREIKNDTPLRQRLRRRGNSR